MNAVTQLLLAVVSICDVAIQLRRRRIPASGENAPASSALRLRLHQSLVKGEAAG